MTLYSLKDRGIKNKKGHKPNGDPRAAKADLYEEGYRVPFIIRWPAFTQRNVVTDRLTCTTDIYATLAEIIGSKPREQDGVDSLSFLSTLKNPKKTDRTAIVHHSISGKFEIREGDWKLILAPGSGGWSKPKDVDAIKQGLPPLQLYNLKEDLAEKNNLTEKHPDKVQHLLKILQTYVDHGRNTPGTPQKNYRNKVNIGYKKSSYHKGPLTGKVTYF